MKKLLAIVLVVLSVFSVTVVASAAMSPLPDIHIDFYPDNPGANFWFKVSYDEARHKAANAELAKIAALEDQSEYFGAAGEEAKEILGSDEIEVCEFAPVAAGNYKEEMGNVKLAISCPTVYAEGQPVAVLFGYDGDWRAFEGVGTADGKVEVTLDPEMVLEVQNTGKVLMAIAI